MRKERERERKKYTYIHTYIHTYNTHAEPARRSDGPGVVPKKLQCFAMMYLFLQYPTLKRFGFLEFSNS